MNNTMKTCGLCGNEMKRIHFTSYDTFFNRCECGTCIINDNQPHRNLAYHDVKLYGCPKCGMVIMSTENDD